MEKITTNDSEARSADIVSENIERLKDLFPEAFTEGKVDFSVLRQLLAGELDEGEEKYGLNWHGKRRARQLALTPSTGTLRPCSEESVAWDTTQNLMIEGDNLEVLKLLQKSYAGKVKLIYIDPPYNTGKDFVYPDDYRDSIRNYLELTGQIDGENRKLSSNTEASGRFHTDWLNMMYPRLKLARHLLCSTGFLCVSIGDEEMFSLRYILNEIFGEENHRNTIALKRYDKNLSRQFMNQGLPSLSIGFEYILVYSKSPDALMNPVFRKASSKRKNTGYWKGFWNAPDRPTMRYELLGVTPENGQWKWKEDTALEAVANYKEYMEMYESQYSLEEHWMNTGEARKFIRRNPNGRGANKGVEHWIPPSDSILRSSNWTDKLASHPVDDIPFSHPKNISPLRMVVQLCTGSKDTVLDFFAGSGTTAYAVMDQNAIDDGNRRYILVQLPEPLDPYNKDQKLAAEFCDRLDKPRTVAELTKCHLRSAAKKDKYLTFTCDLGFRVFKLDTSNIRAWEPDSNDLEGTLLANIDHIKPDRSQDDILYELLLKLGLDLCVPIETRVIVGKAVYSIGAGTLIACLDEKIAREEVESLAVGITAWHSELAPTGDSTVIFRDSAFENDVAKTNLAAILEQYGIGNMRSL